MVELKYIHRRKIRRIIAIVGGACASVAVTVGAIALLGQRSAPLTVSLTNSGANLSLSTNANGNDKTVYLVADTVPKYTQVTLSDVDAYDISNPLDNENTQSALAEENSATLIFKYTFYVANNGKKDADYDLTLNLSNPTKDVSKTYDLDDILRVRFYENRNLNEHNYVTYAKRATSYHYDENGQRSWKEQIAGENSGYAEEFISNKVILKSSVTSLKPGEMVRTSFVFWLEGEDEEGKGEAPISSALVLGVSISAHEAKDIAS